MDNKSDNQSDNQSMEWDKIGELIEEIRKSGPYGYSKVFAIRIREAYRLEKEGDFFNALCLRTEACAVLCLFCRRKSRRRTSR